jgi:ABC-2 type transport system ATP-binding protein
MSESAIEIRDLHFGYGRKEVLAGVNLEVPRGTIFGFLGRNGAGKTTTIKALLGLLRPKSGTCRVLGVDPQQDPLAVRRGVGYMAEDQKMYGWMTVDQIIRWVASFYSKWDRPFTDKLLEVLQLDRNVKVQSLSKGQNSRLALALALGHRPQVVVLDDPTLGLDPIARKEFLRYVIGLMQGHGAAVFFSSHLLYEIEPVADYVAILDQGRIVKAAKTFDLREGVRRFVLADAAKADLTRIQGVLDVAAQGDRIAVIVEECDPAKRAAIRGLGAGFVREVGLNLDEIFEAYVIGNRGRKEQTA